MQIQPSAMGSAPGEFQRPQLAMPFIAVAVLSAVLVFLQALLAGRGWYVDRDLFDIHEIVANVVFLAVVAQVALVFALGVPAGSFRAQLLTVNALLVVLVIAQIGLGYGIRDSSEAGAWHIPNGVRLFGLSAYNLALLSRLRR
ncbi:MAG: hypothetical protein ACRDJH_06550 [Thermomicrobiales bacterium]